MSLKVVVIPFPIRLRRVVWGGFTESNHQIVKVPKDNFMHPFKYSMSSEEKFLGVQGVTL